MPLQQEYKPKYPSASEINVSTLCNTASSTSLSSLRMGTVNSSRAEVRHTWPQLMFVDKSKLRRMPGSNTAAAASAPNLSTASVGISVGVGASTAARARSTKRVQFAGDVFEDWLLADSLLPPPPTSASSALIAGGRRSHAGTSTSRRVHFAGEEYEDEDKSTPLLSTSTPPSSFEPSAGKLTREIIASELDSLPNGAPQAAMRHIRFAGADSDALSAAALIASRRAIHSAPASHIAFLPLRSEHNHKGQLKRKARSASPCPRRRTPATLHTDVSDASTVNDNTSTADPQLTRMHAHTQSKLDADLSTLLSVSAEAPAQRAKHSSNSRLREFRAKLKKRRFEKLRSRHGDGDVQAYNRRFVKMWVSEQRRIGSREDQAYLMADV